MRRLRYLLIIAGLAGCPLLYGCMPKPHVDSQQNTTPTQQAPASAHPNRFGSFNLQKRHGLGGWDQQSGPSEQELLNRMSTQPQANPVAASKQ